MWKHCNFINPPKLWKKELEMSLRPTWGVGDVATLPDWKVLFLSSFHPFLTFMTQGLSWLERRMNTCLCRCFWHDRMCCTHSACGPVS